jgi:hypothetical protein
MTEQVKQPKHYDLFDDLEVIDVIASSMTVEEFRGFCLGNVLKYKLRAGKKDDLAQDMAKADYYRVLFNKCKDLCRGVQL